MTIRVCRFLFLILCSWCVMTVTHELGHIIGGTCGGGTLRSANLMPWRIPFSIFEPDPYPLVTLWAGLILGILIPLAGAIIVNREWGWFIANFCILANGVYIGVGWWSGERFLDTQKLLAHGASPWSIAVYSVVAIGIGYVGFRRSCIVALQAPSEAP